MKSAKELGKERAFTFAGGVFEVLGRFGNTREIEHARFSREAVKLGGGGSKLGHLATAVLSGIDTAGTRIPGEILKRRSAGIKDLRHGYIVDDDWLGRAPDAYESGEGTRVALLEKATYYFISATITVDPEHPLGQLAGDVLVRVPSASGPRIVEGAFALETRSYGGVLHHELQNHPDVYAFIRTRIAGGPSIAAPKATASPT